MTSGNHRVPNWFWVVSIVLLFWNLLGIAFFLMQFYATEESLQSLPADQLRFQTEFLSNYPSWAWVAYGIAVFAGTLGWLVMLLRRRAASKLFILSLAGIVIQLFYTGTYILKGVELFGPSSLLTPISIIVLALFALWFAGYGSRKAWLT